MIIDERQEKAFWDAIEVFSSTGALPHIMVIGSWAEYLYTYYFVDGYEPNVRTRHKRESFRNKFPFKDCWSTTEWSEKD